MGKFLFGEQLSKKIKTISKGGNKRYAVAFWGDGAFKVLFPDDSAKGAQVICDLSMGATNPAEIRKLQKKGAEVRHIESFHGKLYLSDKGVVVASANASQNALGFKGGAKHVETGGFHKSGSKVHKQVKKWFSGIWDEAKEVDKAVLDEAKIAWQDKVLARKSAHPTKSYRENMTLLDVLRECPDEFGAIKFVITWEELSEEEVEEINENLREDAFSDLDMGVFKSYLDFDTKKLEDFFDFEGDSEKWPHKFVSINLSDEKKPAIRLCTRGSIEIVEIKNRAGDKALSSLHLARVHRPDSESFSEISKFEIDGKKSKSQFKGDTANYKKLSKLRDAVEENSECPFFFSAQDLHAALFGRPIDPAIGC